MVQVRENTYYKGISLCIKAGIIAASCWYIYTKVFHRADQEELDRLTMEAITGKGLLLFIFVCLLMPLNWGLEGLKWRILLKEEEQLSFSQAMKGVLCGVAVSTVTPNRTGEFAGRIFLLKKADKLKAAFLSMLGGASQLFITMSMAALTFFFTRGTWGGEFALGLNALSVIALFATALALMILLLSRLLLDRERSSSNKWIKALSGVKALGLKTLLLVTGLSFLRYVVFFFQFYLLLQLLGAEVMFSSALALIPLTFFAIAIVPTFALTEIGVRGAAAMVIFEVATTNTTAVVAASFLLWIINVAVPALVGCLFVFRLKFFSSEQ